MKKRPKLSKTGLFGGCVPVTTSIISPWYCSHTLYLHSTGSTTWDAEPPVDGRHPKQLPKGCKQTLLIMGYLPNQLVSRISANNSRNSHHGVLYISKFLPKTFATGIWQHLKNTTRKGCHKPNRSQSDWAIRDDQDMWCSLHGISERTLLRWNVQ